MRDRATACLGAAVALLAAGCVSELAAGTQVPIALVTRGVTADGWVERPTDLGYDVHLEQALLVSSGVELVRCKRSGVAAQVWRHLSPISTAFAHLEGSPTMLGTTIVEDLSQPNTQPYGLLRPPPDAYCGVHLWLLSADDDAVNVRGLPAAGGHTLIVRGTWMRDGDAAPFELTSTLRYDFAVPMRIELGGASTAPLSVVRDVRGLFDGVDFAAGAVDPTTLTLNSAACTTVERVPGA